MAIQVMSLKRKFAELVAEWKSRKSHSSCVEEMAMHPAYQRIIGLGPAAVPLLLAELQKAPDHWFWALHAITGADPIPPNRRGNVLEMSKAWIEWGKTQDFSGHGT